MTSLPLYRQIEQYLLEQIQNGSFPVNHKIPAEKQLACDFGVSRMTANKAIARLVQDGYLSRHAGLGTFVTDRKAESSLLELHNIADEVRARGFVYSNDVICLESLPADDAIALNLGIPLYTSVFHSILVHRENNLPIQLEDRYINPRWVPHYLQTDFSQHTPNEVLVSNCPLSHMEHIVEATLASEQEAQWLEMPPAGACLSLLRRTWSGDNLISYARLIHPGKRYKLRTTLANKVALPKTTGSFG